MKMQIFSGAMLCSLFIMPAQAEKLIDLPEWQYANVLQEGAFTCGLKNSNYQAAVSRMSSKASQLRTDYMACIQEWSAKAQAGLAPAVKQARSESVKSALKELYGAWDSYFSVLRPGLEKSQYEMSRGKLKAELLSN